jgi:hypothetical protein
MRDAVSSRLCLDESSACVAEATCASRQQRPPAWQAEGNLRLTEACFLVHQLAVPCPSSAEPRLHA